MFIRYIDYSPYQLKPILIDHRLAKTSFRKHPFLNENYIVSVVSSAIQTGRVKWIDEEHFEVKGRRKKNGDFVSVTCTIHDRRDYYLVGKVHVEPLK